MTQSWKDQPYEPSDDDRPGDPVCLLRRVCQRCGSVADEDPPTTCPACQASIPKD
jgi:rubrerythrin